MEQTYTIVPALKALSEKVGFEVELYRNLPVPIVVSEGQSQPVIPNMYQPRGRGNRTVYQYLTSHPQFLLGGVRERPTEFYSAVPQVIATFKMVEFPGCCGICICTGFSMNRAFQHMGLNALCNIVCQAIARDCGYTYLMGSDIIVNEGMRKTLKRNEWKDILKFTNKRTANELAVSIKEL